MRSSAFVLAVLARGQPERIRTAVSGHRAVSEGARHHPGSRPHRCPQRHPGVVQNEGRRHRPLDQRPRPGQGEPDHPVRTRRAGLAADSDAVAIPAAARRVLHGRELRSARRRQNLRRGPLRRRRRHPAHSALHRRRDRSRRARPQALRQEQSDPDGAQLGHGDRPRRRAEAARSVLRVRRHRPGHQHARQREDQLRVRITAGESARQRRRP